MNAAFLLVLLTTQGWMNIGTMPQNPTTQATCDAWHNGKTQICYRMYEI